MANRAPCTAVRLETDAVPNRITLTELMGPLSAVAGSRLSGPPATPRTAGPTNWVGAGRTPAPPHHRTCAQGRCTSALVMPGVHEQRRATRRGLAVL